MENNKIKEELRTIYYFLNNTKGNIEDYEVKYLYDTYNINERVYGKDIHYLSELIEDGEKDDEFIDFFIKLIEEHHIIW